VVSLPAGTTPHPGDVVGLAFPAEAMILFASDGRRIDL
jgi:hypothetical protein